MKVSSIEAMCVCVCVRVHCLVSSGKHGLWSIFSGLLKLSTKKYVKHCGVLLLALRICKRHSRNFYLKICNRQSNVIKSFLHYDIWESFRKGGYVFIIHNPCHLRNGSFKLLLSTLISSAYPVWCSPSTIPHESHNTELHSLSHFVKFGSRMTQYYLCNQILECVYVLFSPFSNSSLCRRSYSTGLWMKLWNVTLIRVQDFTTFTLWC